MSALNQLLAYSSGQWAWRSRENIRRWTAIGVSGNGRMLYGASGNMLYTSSDKGVTWSVINTIQTIYKLLPSYDGRTMYALTSPDKILYSVKISYDYGLTWFDTAFNNLDTHPGEVCSSMYCDILYVRTSGGTYKSSNFGVTFTKVNNLSKSVQISGGMFCNPTGQDVYIFNDATSLVRSRDAGSTWSNISSSVGFSHLAASADGTVIMGLVSSTAGSASDGVHVSLDSGATWVIRVKIGGTDGLGPCAMSQDGRIMYYNINTSSTGSDRVSGSRNFGVTWEDEYRLYIGQVSESTRLFCSHDGETVIATQDGTGTISGTYYYVGSEEE